MPPQTSPQVDAYIQAAEPFAQPILRRIREAFHEGCPEVREVIKWSFPHFEHEGLLGSMAAFKAHVSIGFWKGDQMADAVGLFDRVGNSRMAARKLRSIADLPDHATLVGYVRQAVALNVAEAGKPREKRGPRKKASQREMPADLATALASSPLALATFEGLSPSHRNEYIEWIVEARQQTTRERRISTAISWLAEGKPRNWKYMKPAATG